jgi:hypothetical protein
LSQITSRPRAVRGHDRERVDAVGTLGFFGQQLGVIAVGALVGDADRPGRGARTLGVAAQHRGHHLEMVVEARGGAVHGADERAGPPADHAEPQPAPETRDRRVHARLPTDGARPAFGGCEPRAAPL